ncbi:MAG: hypothetical protein J6O60_04575 [Lachnospiraceae bacterium]|nr:hypothetical protein [Lachnospiraceae bacterium]
MSKSSFWINERWNFKTRHASIILNFMAWFVVLTVVTLVSQILFREGTVRNLWERTAQIIYGQTALTIGMNVIVGVGMAIEAFGWMNNMSQVDMYKSVPVKESTRFAYINLNSFIIYIGGFMINFLLEIVLLAVNGAIHENVHMYLIYMALLSITTFLGTYALALVAVFLTGNSVLAFMGGAFLNLVEMILVLMWGLGKSVFYAGYDFNVSIDEYFLGIFTPICMAINSMGALLDERYAGYLKATFTTKMIWIAMVVILVQAVVYMILAYGLYKKRYANVAGRRIVFEMAKPPIEIAILVVAGFATGLMMEILGGRKVAIIVVIVMVVILHVILKMILDSKIKFSVRGGVSLAIGAGLAILLFAYPAYDLGGYKTYVPDSSEIEGYSVIFNYYADYNYYELREDSIDDVNSTAYIYDNVIVTDEAAVEEFLDAMEDAVHNSDDDINEVGTVRVRYHMKNGRSKYREYNVNQDQYIKAYVATYSDINYRKGVNPFEYNRNIVEYFVNDEGASWNTSLSCFSFGNEGTDQNFDKDIYFRLYDAMEADMNERDVNVLVGEAPIGVLGVDLAINDGPYRGNYVNIDVPVYQSDLRTMKIVDELGWMQKTSSDFNDSISKIEITKTRRYMDDGDVYTDEDSMVEFDDPKDIEEIMKYAYSDEINITENCMLFLDYGYYGSIVTTENGGGYHGMYFAKDKVPQLVLDAFEDKANK